MTTNRVLQEEHSRSSNFFQSDLIFRDLLSRHCSAEGLQWMNTHLDKLGLQLGSEIDRLAAVADREVPVLRHRNLYGEADQEIEFHPAYGELLSIAVDSGMFSVKWNPENRQKFSSERHRLGFSAGQLYTMGETGVYCPLCMTDGVARIIDRFGTEEDKSRLLPRIYTDDASALFTGAMFLTEKSGGSDVGANLVEAHQKGDKWLLNGEKWFCSNANAELILVLARTDKSVPGTRGLSIFLVEKSRKDGSVNPREILRLKEKLGVRSMASAEILLRDTEATLLGAEGEGFMIMTEMINLSRLYNSVAAVGSFRRALVEAWQFLMFRSTFGKPVLEHALVRDKMAELCAGWIAESYLTWRTIEALDMADQGDENSANLVRLLTPMVKRSSANAAVYGIRECMELMGGVGYIEQGVLPRIMRDAMVLPIWEGAGNIMVLDMLRAATRSTGLAVLEREMQDLSGEGRKLTVFTAEVLTAIRALDNLDRDETEVRGKFLFDRLTKIYQAGLMWKGRTDKNESWINPAFEITVRQLEGKTAERAPSKETVQAMMGWEIK